MSARERERTPAPSGPAPAALPAIGAPSASFTLVNTR